jgi:hypothetical protein
VEQVVCDEYYTDVPVITAFGKVHTQVPRVGLFQEIV